MTTGKATALAIKALRVRIERCKEKLAADRDELRDLLDEGAEILDTVDRAQENLEAAVDALSELL